MSMTRERIIKLQGRHLLVPWLRRKDATASIVVERADGRHFTDMDGTSWFDGSSQLINLNAGWNHPGINEAIRRQVETGVCYAAPGFGVGARARAAELMAEITPGDLTATFFALGGAEAVCKAIRMARMWAVANGRGQTILSSSRSYHGSVGEADAASGDPRSWPHRPGNPGFVHVQPPYVYRDPLGHAPHGNLDAHLAYFEAVIQQEGPKTIAAVLWEAVSGTSGLWVPPAGYWQGIRRLCDKYGILLICDEVMTGFGRTGYWFATEYEGVVPDLLVTSKGITGAYVPLGAVTVRQHMADFFDDRALTIGLTASAQPLACAAAVGAITAYREDGMVENSARMGAMLLERLRRFQEVHPCVGDVRGIGLFAVLELVVDRETREPLSPQLSAEKTAGIKAVEAAIKANGLFTLTRWNWIFVAPPLNITQSEVDELCGMLDPALTIGDQHYTGAGA